MTEQINKTEDPGVIQEVLDANPELNAIGAYEYGWADKDDAGANAKRGIDSEVVADISGKKDEPSGCSSCARRA